MKNSTKFKSGYQAAKLAHLRGEDLKEWNELANSSPDFDDFDRGVLKYCNEQLILRNCSDAIT